MRVTEVKYSKKFNLGNYESEEFGLTAVLEEDDVAQVAFIGLKNEVAIAYSGEVTKPEPEELPEPKKGKKKAKPEPEVEEETEEEESEETEVEETEETEDEVDDEPKAAKGKKSKFKKKPQTYLRSNETHKEIFSNVLKTVAPDWKKTTESKAKAKAASQKLEGEEFLDENGEVLATFKAAVKKAMGKNNG